MCQCEFAHMEREPRDQGLLLVAALVASFQVGQQQLDLGHTVKRVVENWRANGGKMHAELMGAAGERAALHECKPSKALDRANLRRAGLAAAALADAHPPLLLFVLAEREIDGERVRQR